MRRPNPILAIATVMSLVVPLISPRLDSVVHGQQTADERSEVDRDSIRRQLYESMRDYRFESGNGSTPLRLIDEPLARWSNPISGIEDGLICGWCDQEGRPQILAQSFRTRRGELAHEFQSVATQSLQGEVNDSSFWQPAVAGIEMKPLASSPPVGATPVRRLTQMSQIAKQFSGEVEFKLHPSDQSTSTYQLRLMARPIYRYGTKSGQVIDGAVFSLVQGTNPEAWLLIEARPTENGLAWHFGIAGMTGYTVRVAGPDTIRWEKKNRQGTRGRTDLPYLFRIHAKTFETAAYAPTNEE